MKMNKKIFLYLDNQLSDSEKIQFEKELQNSSELMAQFEKYRKTINQFSGLKQIEVDDKYFINLLPRVREKIHTKKLKRQKTLFNPEFALAASSFIAVSVLLFFTILSNSNNNLVNMKSVTTKISTEDIDETLNYYDNNIDETINSSSFGLNTGSDSLINNALANELLNNGDNNIANYIVNDDVNYSSLAKEINPENIEIIYDKLKHKRYF